MQLLNNIVLVIAIIVAVIFSLLVLVTGKGDAMGGGGSVRTSFKGKASFDDIISKWTLYMGISFMSLVLLYTVVNNRIHATDITSGIKQTPAPVPSTPAATPETTKPEPAATNTPDASSAGNKPAEPTKN